MRNNGLLRSAADTIRRYDMLRPGERVLVALSGGADSVSLLLVLQALGYEVRAFHLNHCLRGAESDRDEAFCRALCAERGVPLHVGRCDIAALSQGKAVEETARRERYRLLERAAEGDKVATAHTADDNLETVLFHLVRGSGAKGVSGIPPVRGAVIRPLLFAERREIEAFLRENGQDYVTDSSNLSDDYTRNRLRHSVLPVLRGINEQAAQAALRLGEQLRQDEACLGGQAERCLQIALRADGAYLTAPFLACHPAVQGRALREAARRAGMPMRDLAQTHIEALERLLSSADPSARLDLPHGFTARREYEEDEGNHARQLMTARYLITGQCRQPEALPLTVPFDGLWTDRTRVKLRKLEKSEVFYKTVNTFCADCGTIDFASLCVRARQTGDRLRLTEKGGSRTLKKLMIDRKIPAAERDALAVIADRSGVIAVQDIGMDLSRRPGNGARLEIKIERN